MTRHIIVVGAGIVGLGVALAGHRAGFRVTVLDRNATQRGASIRNFGFVTVTGQQRGDHWARAKRSAEIWKEIAPAAKIDICHRGLIVACQRPEATAVIESFLDTEMGEGCQMMTPAEACEFVPRLAVDGLDSALYSPHEVRVESRVAITQLTQYLTELGVSFMFSEAVVEVSNTSVLTSTGRCIQGDCVAVCPGPDLNSLYPDWIARRHVELCTLQMLKVEGLPPGAFQAGLMSDLSLIRYEGYAALPAAAALRERLLAEQGAEIAAGVHLIAVQGLDGGLIVGDSHVYGDAESAFAESRVDRLILGELEALIGAEDLHVTERWLGTYPSAATPCFVDAPSDSVRLVMVTGGTGASTAFALGEDVIRSL